MPFGLGRTDGLTLARDGTQVDAVTWTEALLPEAAGLGRLPDGTGSFAATEPTRGGPNRAFDGTVPPEPPFGEEHVAEVRIELSPEAWGAILADPLAEAWKPASLDYDGVRLEQVQLPSRTTTVRRSGPSSSSARIGADSQ